MWERREGDKRKYGTEKKWVGNYWKVERGEGTGKRTKWRGRDSGERKDGDKGKKGIEEWGKGNFRVKKED